MRYPLPNTCLLLCGSCSPPEQARQSQVLQFSPLWFAGPNPASNAVDYAKHRSRSHHAVIRVYDEIGNVIGTHEHTGEFKECP
jgi:hypothetical protein